MYDVYEAARYHPTARCKSLAPGALRARMVYQEWSEELDNELDKELLYHTVHRLLRKLQLTEAHSSQRVDQIQRVHKQQLARQQRDFAELQHENAELRSDNEKLGTYDDHHRQHLESVQHELAVAQTDLNIARAAAWDLNIAQVRLHRQSMRVDELETELETARSDISRMHQVLQEIRDKHEVDLRKLARDMGAHTALEVAAKDRRIYQFELRWLMSSEVKPAFDIIFKHGPLVAFSKFSVLLYAADERARPAVLKAGGMKLWLQSMPEYFELHGEGQPGYEQVSLSGSAERAPTEAGLKATTRMSDGAGPSGTALPVCQGSDAASSGATSDEKVKMCMGRAAARRDGATGDTRRMLNEMIHIRDKDPHKHGHNRFIDEATGRRLEERMRAELGKGKKVHRAQSAPRGRPSADARTSGDR